MVPLILWFSLMHQSPHGPQSFRSCLKPMNKRLGGSVNPYSPLFAAVRWVSPSTDVAVAVNDTSEEIMK
jgi:hypothetical protein